MSNRKSMLRPVLLTLAFVFAATPGYAAEPSTSTYSGPIQTAQLGDYSAPVQIARQGDRKPGWRVRHYKNAIAADAGNLLRDPVCGRPAILKAKHRFFDNLKRNLSQAAKIGAKGRTAVKALAPVVGDTGLTIALTQEVARKYPKSKQSAQALLKVLEELKSDVGTVVQGRIPAAAANTWTLLAKFGVPFTAKCVGCAKGVIGATKNLAKAAGWGASTAGATFICPETVGASCVAAAGTTAVTVWNVAKAAANAAGAVAGCGLAAKQWWGKKDEFRTAFDAFRSSSAALVQGTVQTARQVGAARTAFKALRKSAGNEAKQELDKIDVHLIRIAKNVKTASDIVKKEVRPAVVALGNNVFDNISIGVADLERCRTKIKKLVGHGPFKRE